MFSLDRVLMSQGKVREKWNFAKVRELSGNFDECQGNLKNEAKVREMSGNFETLSGKFAFGWFNGVWSLKVKAVSCFSQFLFCIKLFLII